MGHITAAVTIVLAFTARPSGQELNATVQTRCASVSVARRDPYTPHYSRSVGASARARTEGRLGQSGIPRSEDGRTSRIYVSCCRSHRSSGVTAKHTHAVTIIVACSSQTSTVA